MRASLMFTTCMETLIHVARDAVPFFAIVYIHVIVILL